MRDAFGGAFLIKIFLIFIIVYVGFIAIALNYAKAFKVKDAIVNYLEDNEIVDLNNAFVAAEMQNFVDNEILGNMNYYAEISCTGDNIVYCDNGIKIEKIKPLGNANIGIYYKVSTSFGWTLPFMNTLLKAGNNDATKDPMTGTWIISGETRLIVNE